MSDPKDQAERDLIEFETGKTLFVNAGAGSGKTTALVRRVAQLVLSDGITMEQIAAVTFTEKAGAELRDRLRERFEESLREAGDDVQRARASAALDAIDSSAIGTLHSFAQRILMAHPFEANLPPAIEILDEVASSIAADERWARIQQELLDDEEIAEPLLLGMSLGVTLKHVLTLVRKLGADWDLVERKVLASRPAPPHVPPMHPVSEALGRVRAVKDRCLNQTDRLYPIVVSLEATLARLEAADEIPEVLEVTSELADLKLGNTGATASWGCSPKEIRDELKAAISRALDLRHGVVDQCLRHLTHWAGQKVVAAAEERRSEGRLEFHDLLVLARDLLMSPDHGAHVRESLHSTYERLLLDEFQDTDPIQIELAVRIAGGRDADQERWEDVDVPAGRLFVVGDGKQSIYRFRRANIALYLRTQELLGEQVTLSTNFRTIPPIVDWVNDVFGTLIQPEGDGQPDYDPLVADRAGSTKPSGEPVTILGPQAHPGKPSADQLRDLEASDVAAVIDHILDDKTPWTVYDERTKSWRPAKRKDIAILVPSRSSMPMLEQALDAAGVHFRAEAMSLIYEAEEVRELLLCARAIADPSDQLALVETLRSPLFGCGDDDLWQWRHAKGRFDLFAKPPTEELENGPVGTAIAYLRKLHRRARWLTPSEVLTAIAVDRRVFEVAAGRRRTHDSWRRLRYVIDQARAWTEVSHGGLRGYLAWVSHQATDGSRVSEAILPEHDVDAVRVMTVHAAKGLEFPIVVLSGMSAQYRVQNSLRLLWTKSGYEVSIRKELQSSEFDDHVALDEQMDDLEKIRLLYVAATRARDHLVVSLHRGANINATTAATLLEGAGAATVRDPLHFATERRPSVTPYERESATPPPEFTVWLEGIKAARKSSREKGAVTASGLEGTEPEVVLAAADDVLAGQAKGPRNLELPPWTKGRYGSAVGRAVHGVLQVVDLATGEGLDEAVQAQALAEGLTGQDELITALVRSALSSELVQRAAVREHWRETYVAAELDGTLTEGIVDLIFREDDGTLTVVDYKTDAVSVEALQPRMTYYKPQLDAYRYCLAGATGAQVQARLLFLHPDRSVDLPVG